MRKTIGNIFDESVNGRFNDILDSVLPGGKNWHSERKGECLTNCPFYNKCKGNGPSNKLCSEEWSETKANIVSFSVLAHVIGNYAHYDCGDYSGEIENQLEELKLILDIKVPEGMSGSEIERLVSVRVCQKEFKENLFSVWEGCSIEGLEVPEKYLIASHIKPWAECESKDERVSCENGFLLPANYDYVFDRHLITFNSSGEICLLEDPESKQLYDVLCIDAHARIDLRPGNSEFLNTHTQAFKDKESYKNYSMSKK